MIVIGEKINGTRAGVGRAIVERDAAFIRALAVEQAEAGATYLDVNAGTAPNREPEDLVWLARTVQAAVATPLCLDSANPEALEAALGEVDKKPLINSVSGEQHRIDGVLPLAFKHSTGLILLALGGEKGIPATPEARIEIVERLVGLSLAGGLAEKDLFVDPLVTAISTGRDNALVTLETIRMVRNAHAGVNITCGLSNVSFGMPLRALINRAFAAMAVEAGLNSAIIDPTDRELMGTILAARMLSGLDRNCMTFNRAYRERRIGPAREEEPEERRAAP